MQWRMAWESVLSTVGCCCLFHDLTWKHSLRMDVRFGVEENMTCLPYTSCVSGSSGKYRSSHLHRVLSVFRVAQSSFPLPSFLHHSQGVNVRLLVRLTPATQGRRELIFEWSRPTYKSRLWCWPRRSPKQNSEEKAAFCFCFFSSTSLLLPTHLPPPSCMHAQSWNPMDCSPPGSSVHEFFQARILEWVAISFSMFLFFFFFLTSIILIKFGKAYGESD